VLGARPPRCTLRCVPVSGSLLCRVRHGGGCAPAWGDAMVERARQPKGTVPPSCDFRSGQGMGSERITPEYLTCGVDPLSGCLGIASDPVGAGPFLGHCPVRATENREANDHAYEGRLYLLYICFCKTCNNSCRFNHQSDLSSVLKTLIDIPLSAQCLGYKRHPKATPASSSARPPFPGSFS